MLGLGVVRIRARGGPAVEVPVQGLDVVRVVDASVRVSQLELVVGQDVNGLGDRTECLPRDQQAGGVLPVARRRAAHHPAEGQELPGDGVDLPVQVGPGGWVRRQRWRRL